MGQLSFPKMLWRGERNSVMCMVRPKKPLTQVVWGGVGGKARARDPALSAVTLPVAPGYPPHTPQSQELPSTKLQRPRQNVSATLHHSDGGQRPREGQGQNFVQSTPQGRWELGENLDFLVCILDNFQHSLKQFLQGPGGNWRKMQSNQLSDVVIIKTTTNPISVWFSAFHLYYFVCPCTCQEQWVPLSLILPLPREEGAYPSPRSVGTRSQLPDLKSCQKEGGGLAGAGVDGGERQGRLRFRKGRGSQVVRCRCTSPD